MKISHFTVKKVRGNAQMGYDISSNYVVQKRWRWLRHVCTMKAEAPRKTALDWTADGKRKRGRPTKKKSKVSRENKRPKPNPEQHSWTWCWQTNMEVYGGCLMYHLGAKRIVATFNLASCEKHEKRKNSETLPKQDNDVRGRIRGNTGERKYK